MTKISRMILALLCLSNTFTFGQNGETSYRQQPALGIHFLLHDFQTATSIRNSSLSRVLANKEFGKVKEMSPGLAISYSEGLHDNFDVAVTLAGSFLDYPRENAMFVKPENMNSDLGYDYNYPNDNLNNPGGRDSMKVMARRMNI